jgi:hypothetical protein
MAGWLDEHVGPTTLPVERRPTDAEAPMPWRGPHRARSTATPARTGPHGPTDAGAAGPRSDLTAYE